MGICYSQQEEWEACQTNYRKRRKVRKKKRQHSIIYEEKSFCESSFASKVQSSFREDLHNTLSNLASDYGSISFGSIVQMPESELEILYKSLEKVNPDGEDYQSSEVLTLCNLKTKNFLHTHKIRHSDYSKQNEVSACPYTSSHILEYDLWKFVQVEEGRYLIYHPFTQKFLGIINGCVVCGDEKHEWKIVDFGRRRNGGFIKIVDAQNNEKQLCMSDEQGLLTDHRKLVICSKNHIGHLWELNFGQCTID